MQRLVMIRLFLAPVAVVGTLAVLANAPKNGALAKSNQVYVKIILPIDPAARDKDRPVVESWILEQLTKRGPATFTAATGWVLLDSSPFSATSVWDGKLDNKQCNCPVFGDIAERADGRIKVLLEGWAPNPAGVTVSLRDEPGSREI